MENDLNKFLLKIWGQWSYGFFKQQLVTWAELETVGCLFGIRMWFSWFTVHTGEKYLAGVFHWQKLFGWKQQRIVLSTAALLKSYKSSVKNVGVWMGKYLGKFWQDLRETQWLILKAKKALLHSCTSNF